MHSKAAKLSDDSGTATEVDRDRAFAERDQDVLRRETDFFEEVGQLGAEIGCEDRRLRSAQRHHQVCDARAAEFRREPTC